MIKRGDIEWLATGAAIDFCKKAVASSTRKQHNRDVKRTKEIKKSRPWFLELQVTRSIVTEKTWKIPRSQEEFSSGLWLWQTRRVRGVVRGVFAANEICKEAVASSLQKQQLEKVNDQEKKQGNALGLLDCDLANLCIRGEKRMYRCASQDPSKRRLYRVDQYQGKIRDDHQTTGRSQGVGSSSGTI